MARRHIPEHLNTQSTCILKLLPLELYVLTWVGSLFIRRVRKIAKSDNVIRHVHPSVRTKLGSQRTAVQEIGYLRIFENLSRKVKFS